MGVFLRMTKSESKRCLADPEKKCDCTNYSDCAEMKEKYAKLVFCRDSKCMFNLDLHQEKPYFIDRGRGHKPFKDDGYTGICTRPDVGFSPHLVSDPGEGKFTSKSARVVTTCTCRANKQLSHMRFPHPDSIQGGNYSDPITPDQIGGAYH